MDVLTRIVLVNNSLAADRLAEGCEISRFSVAVLTWMFFLLFRTGWSFSVVVSKKGWLELRFSHKDKQNPITLQ